MKHGLPAGSWEMLCNHVARRFETFLLRRLRSMSHVWQRRLNDKNAGFGEKLSVPIAVL